MHQDTCTEIDDNLRYSTTKHLRAGQVKKAMHIGDASVSIRCRVSVFRTAPKNER